MSQLDAPFSLARSIAWLSGGGSCSVISLARCVSQARLFCRLKVGFDLWSDISGLVRFLICETKAAVSCSEA